MTTTNTIWQWWDLNINLFKQNVQMSRSEQATTKYIDDCANVLNMSAFKEEDVALIRVLMNAIVKSTCLRYEQLEHQQPVPLAPVSTLYVPELKQQDNSSPSGSQTSNSCTSLSLSEGPKKDAVGIIYKKPDTVYIEVPARDKYRAEKLFINRNKCLSESSDRTRGKIQYKILE